MISVVFEPKRGFRLKRAKEFAVTDYAQSRPSSERLPTAFAVRKNAKHSKTILSPTCFHS
jgi:hypothetical protein